MPGTDLNALIGSRICHDLISPLGAIGNGVELLSMSGLGSTPEIALIAESVENANAKIRFFRIAFGAAPASAEISLSEVKGVLSDAYKGGRIEIDWRVRDPLARAHVKLAFLLLQCLENAMPWGGQIKVTRNGEIWQLEAFGEKLKINADLWSLLSTSEGISEVAAADVHFALAPAAAANVGRKVAAYLSENRITLSF